MKRDFNEWLSNFKTSISNYTYYVDFKKIYATAEKYKVELNILNSLIGSKNIEEEFKQIIIKYPDTLEVIPMLLAVRSKEIFIKDGEQDYLFYFKKMIYPIEDYVRFMKETGLFDLLQNHIINNIYDYLLGVEVGLDSNARKNRGGELMETLVENYIQKAGYIKNENYFCQMSHKEIENKWGLDLSVMSGNDTATKVFDFVIKTENQVYAIETNFYTAGGSKLNETSRSYKMLAEESKKVNGLTFIWITDGQGWKIARKNLEETFHELETIYNINDLNNGIFERL